MSNQYSGFCFTTTPFFLTHKIALLVILCTGRSFKMWQSFQVELVSLLTSVGAEDLKVRSRRRDQNSDRVSSRLRAEPR